MPFTVVAAPWHCHWSQVPVTLLCPWLERRNYMNHGEHPKNEENWCFCWAVYLLTFWVASTPTCVHDVPCHTNLLHPPAFWVPHCFVTFRHSISLFGATFRFSALLCSHRLASFMVRYGLLDASRLWPPIDSCGTKIAKLIAFVTALWHSIDKNQPIVTNSCKYTDC